MLIPAFFIYPSKGFNHSDGEEDGTFLDGSVKDQGASSECSGKKPNDVHTKDHTPLAAHCLIRYYTERGHYALEMSLRP